MNEKNQMKNHI